MFDTITVIPKPADISNTEILIEIPKELTAGIKQAQVLHPLVVGDHASEHGNSNAYNIVPFVIAPQITGKIPSTPLSIGEKLNLTIQPAVADNQQVVVFIGNYMINVKLPTSASTISNLPSIIIPSDLKVKGTKESFLLRVRIDGADSFVRKDNNSTSPTYNQYVPFIEITK